MHTFECETMKSLKLKNGMSIESPSSITFGLNACLVICEAVESCCIPKNQWLSTDIAHLLLSFLIDYRNTCKYP